MKRALLFAAAGLFLVACGAPIPPTTAPSPSATLATTTPSPATITCSNDVPNSIPGGCPAETQAVLLAVVPLGYPVRAVSIRPYGFPCGMPFPAGLADSPAPGCPVVSGGPTAYVTFVGTAKEAGLKLFVRDGSVSATVLGFGVPLDGPAPG